MKSKLVLWGSNAQDEKLMIAVALRMEDNKVDIWTFPESVATEDFYQTMMKDWRDDKEVDLPEPHTHIERELSMSESLLPDDLKVERTDVIQRAQTEWHFLVLSEKLHQSYKDRLEELKESVEKLEGFDQGIWDSLKEFWNKVQDQVRERNLLRDHADTLRDHTNELFAKMKNLRSKMDEEFEKISKEAHDTLMEKLDEIENKVNDGARLPVMFEELKKLQRKFKESKLTREHRGKVWEKLDATFKEVKKRRFGERAADEGNSPLQRIQRRYDGLVSAIRKMEQSIKRDQNDLEYQQHKIATTGGQLEAQIRQAKIKMIEERVNSKEDKLREMNVTKAELEKRIASLKEKETRRAAEKAAKEKIAQEIKTTPEPQKEQGVVPEGSTKKEEKGKTADKKEDSVAEAVGATVGESLIDVVDTIKAAATVIGDKIQDAIEELKDEAGEMVEEAKEKLEEAKEKIEEAKEEIEDEIKEEAGELVDEAKEKLEEAKAKLEEVKKEINEEIAAKGSAEEEE